MAGGCLYNDHIFPDWRGAIGFVCHTKRREAVWVQVDHTHKHTLNPSIMASSYRLPVSTEALINWGQAVAFVLLGQKRSYMVNFYWRQHAASCSSGIMRYRLAQHESCKKNIWFEYIKSVFISTLLLSFFRSLFVINTRKETFKKKNSIFAISHLVTLARNHLDNIN